MATGGLYGSTSTGTVAPQSGSESVGLYGNNTVFGGTYFEWFIFKESATQPATPTGGTWNFTTNVGTAPTGWTSAPPVTPSNQVWVSIGVVNSRSTAAIVWSAPGLFTFGSGTVTNVSALTLGTTGTDVSSTVANPTTTPVITLNLPTASATNRGLLSSADWAAFNAKAPSGTYVTSVTGTTGRITSTGGLTPVIDLASGVATAGTTGSSTLIPVVTIDTYGRVTGITTASNPQGSVTSVAATVPSFLSISGSPITSSGTLAIGYSGTALPVANGGTGALTLTGYVYGNGTGSMTAATTIPTTVLSGTVTNAQLTNSSITINGNVVSLGGSTTITAATISTLTFGTGLSGTSFDGSVPVTIALASGYGDTLNPYASKTANYVLAAPNGAAGVPTFRAIVAADIPTLNQNTTGTAANITATSNSTLTTLSALSLPYSQLSGTVPTWNQNTTGTAANVTGVVAVANGGTGVTTSTGTTSVVLSTGPSLTAPTQVTYENWTPIAAPTYSEGRVWYDSTIKALTYNSDISGNSLHIGQETQLKVRNGTGATIAKGAPVYITSTSTGVSFPNVALAKADTLVTGNCIGLANEAIASGADGYVVINGILNGVNTGTFTVGDTLYVSPYSAGQLMNTFPPTGYPVRIGVVSYVNSSAGSIYINQSNAFVQASSVVGTLAIANGGTGQTTATAAFNALSPVTTTGDLIIGNGTNSSTRLGIGANGYVLTSNGTTATWSAATGGVSQIIAGTNVTISPAGGTGVVTINSTGGGGGSSAYTRTTFTATAGQTAFTVTYAVGYLQIYVNGVLLTGSDYTATSGTGFTLNVACIAGDVVEALVITTSVTGVTTGKAIAMAMIFGY